MIGGGETKKDWFDNWFDNILRCVNDNGNVSNDCWKEELNWIIFNDSGHWFCLGSIWLNFDWRQNFNEIKFSGKFNKLLLYSHSIIGWPNDSTIDKPNDKYNNEDGRTLEIDWLNDAPNVNDVNDDNNNKEDWRGKLNLSPNVKLISVEGNDNDTATGNEW